MQGLGAHLGGKRVEQAVFEAVDLAGFKFPDGRAQQHLGHAVACGTETHLFGSSEAVVPSAFHLCRDFLFYQSHALPALCRLRFEQRVFVVRREQVAERLLNGEFVVAAFQSVELPPRVADLQVAAVPVLAFRGFGLIGIKRSAFQPGTVADGHLNGLVQRHLLLGERT